MAFADQEAGHVRRRLAEEPVRCEQKKVDLSEGNTYPTAPSSFARAVGPRFVGTRTSFNLQSRRTYYRYLALVGCAVRKA